MVLRLVMLSVAMGSSWDFDAVRHDRYLSLPPAGRRGDQDALPGDASSFITRLRVVFFDAQGDSWSLKRLLQQGHTICAKPGPFWEETPAAASINFRSLQVRYLPILHLKLTTLTGTGFASQTGELR